MNFFIAELRGWVKTKSERDTFQGYVYNDDSHTHENGKFITLEADEVQEHSSGLIVTVKKHLYYLWDSFKRKSE